MRLIDRLPWAWVIVIATWLAIAPVVPEPHLIEKSRMLAAGILTRPLDIFDLLLHGVPLLVLAIKAARSVYLRRTRAVEKDSSLF